MKISRENYEIWFMDWLDNNLTGSQTTELNSFLDENPDLHEEFNDLCVAKLNPASGSFKGKDNLLRSSSEMTERQFEILCAAAAENDLTNDHQKELEEIISADPGKGSILQIYKRLRLEAPEITYNNKKKLFRITAAQKVYRIAWISLSAAAVAAIVFMSGVLNRDNSTTYTGTIAITEKIQDPAADVKTTEAKNELTDKIQSQSERKSLQTAAQNKQVTPDVAESHFEKATAPEKVNIGVRPVIYDKITDHALIASDIQLKSVPELNPDDGRSNIGRFIAQRFRSKVLDEPVPSDKPLKGYEIAGAGIDGLNKLLGWQMALTTKNDENGDVTSLNFNSRMLKFNTPIKNNGSSE